MRHNIKNFFINNFTSIFYISIAILIFSISQIFGAGQAGIGNQGVPLHNHSGKSQGGSIQALRLNGNFLIETNNEGNILMRSRYDGSFFSWYPAKSSLFAVYNANGIFPKEQTNSIWLGTDVRAGNYSGAIGFGVHSSTARYNSWVFGNYLETNANNSIVIGQGNVSNYAVNNDTNSVKIYNDNVLNSGKPNISISSIGVVSINDQIIVSTYSIIKPATNLLQTKKFTWSSTGSSLFKNNPFVLNFQFQDNIRCEADVYAYSAAEGNSILIEPIINYSTYTGTWNTRYIYTNSSVNSKLTDISSARGAFMPEGGINFYQSKLSIYYYRVYTGDKVFGFISHNTGANSTFETRGGNTSSALTSSDNLTGILITSDRNSGTTGSIVVNMACYSY